MSDDNKSSGGGIGIGNPAWGASGQKQFIFRHQFFKQVCFGKTKRKAELLENVFYCGCLIDKMIN